MALSPDLVDQLTPRTPAPGESELAPETEMTDSARRRLAWTRFLRSEDFYREYIAQIAGGLRACLEIQG